MTFFFIPAVVAFGMNEWEKRNPKSDDCWLMILFWWFYFINIHYTEPAPFDRVALNIKYLQEWIKNKYWRKTAVGTITKFSSTHCNVLYFSYFIHHYRNSHSFRKIPRTTPIIHFKKSLGFFPLFISFHFILFDPILSLCLFKKKKEVFLFLIGTTERLINTSYKEIRPIL